MQNWHVKLLALAVSATALAGCNKVYFYETEKASLTVEARPDPTAPLTGNIGIKERIAAIVPPTEPAKKPTGPLPVADQEKVETLIAEAAALNQAATTRQAAGDTKGADQRREKASKFNAEAWMIQSDARGNALSVISSFRFHKHPPQTGVLSPRVTIDAALITGNAAQSVAKNGKVNASIGALSGAPDVVDSVSLITMNLIKNAFAEIIADAPDSPAAAAATIHRDALNALVVDLPGTYPVPIYSEDLDGNTHVLRVDAGKNRGDRIPAEKFEHVVSYGDQLQKSATRIRDAIARVEKGEPQTLKLNGGNPIALAPADRLVIAGLRKDAADTDQALRIFREHFSRHPALQAALRTFYGF